MESSGLEACHVYKALLSRIKHEIEGGESGKPNRQDVELYLLERKYTRKEAGRQCRSLVIVVDPLFRLIQKKRGPSCENRRISRGWMTWVSECKPNLDPIYKVEIFQELEGRSKNCCLQHRSAREFRRQADSLLTTFSLHPPRTRDKGGESLLTFFSSKFPVEM